MAHPIVLKPFPPRSVFSQIWVPNTLPLKAAVQATFWARAVAGERIARNTRARTQGFTPRPRVRVYCWFSLNQVLRMILKRFYDERLAQASYLIGCGATGQAIVFDPNRDVEQYVDAARAERVKITHVTETHIHADFVSGTRELAARMGAKLLLSAEGGTDWQYAFGQEPNAKLVRDGEEFQVGNIRIQVWHTPGHTPEHIIFFITDGAAADKPIGVVTGDFVFVGDVGRPDLLEKAARVEGTMDQAARDLFRSLQRFKAL